MMFASLIVNDAKQWFVSVHLVNLRSSLLRLRKTDGDFKDLVGFTFQTDNELHSFQLKLTSTETL